MDRRYLLSILFMSFLIVAMVDSDDFGIFVILSFSAFIGLGLFLALYAAKWKIIAAEGTYTIVQLFRPTSTVLSGDITQAQEKYNGLVVYASEKRYHIFITRGN